MTYTPIHNRFWSDGWIRGLNALDRYLFLYLLTNGRARLTGIYELPLDLMASESGIDQRDLMVMLKRLEPKIYYHDGWVIAVNYLKHHIAGGHKFGQGVKAQFEEIPKKIQDIARGYGYPIDTLYIVYPRFPDRIEENRIDKKAVAPQRASLSGITEVRLNQQGEEKVKKEPRDKKAWVLREKLCGVIEKEIGVYPLTNAGDYKQVQKALEFLTEPQILEMFEDAAAKKPLTTIRNVLTDREIDVKRRDVAA